MELSEEIGGTMAKRENLEVVATTTTTTTTKQPRKRKLIKKSPSAPKRFRSSFICFVREKMQETKQSLPKSCTSSDAMKVLSVLWSEMSSSDKEYYEALAEKDKVRYIKELSSYSGPLHIPNKRVKKPPDAPKRPMSAFLLYSQAMRSQAKLDFPHLTNNQLSVILAQQWHQASETIKEPYVKRELEARQKYHHDVAQWRASKRSVLVRDKLEPNSTPNISTNESMSVHGSLPHIHISDMPSNFWDLLDSEIFEEHERSLDTETSA